MPDSQKSADEQALFVFDFEAYKYRRINSVSNIERAKTFCLLISVYEDIPDSQKFANGKLLFEYCIQKHGEVLVEIQLTKVL